MIDSGFFLAIAGLGVSIAGFAALMFSFREGEVGRLTGWRIRYIVTGGFTLTGVSIGVVAAAVVTADPDLQVRLASVLGILAVVPNAWTYRSLGDAEIFRSRREAAGWVAGGVLVHSLFGINLVVASYEVVVVMWVFMLASAMSLFAREVSDLYRPPSRRSRSGAE